MPKCNHNIFDIVSTNDSVNFLFIIYKKNALPFFLFDEIYFVLVTIKVIYIRARKF